MMARGMEKHRIGKQDLLKSRKRATILKHFSTQAAISTNKKFTNVSEIASGKNITLEKDQDGQIVIKNETLMPYYEGGSLDKKIKSLSFLESLAISLDIAKGLRMLHDNGVIHDDLKPANILLYRKDRNYRAAIADFGLSWFISHAPNGVYNTHFGKGTRSFLAPEARGFLGGRRGKASDVWSFGTTLYCLVERVQQPPILSPIGYSIEDYAKTDKNLEMRMRRKAAKTKGPLGNYYHLIADMLKYNPKERPSIEEIEKRLISITNKIN